MPVSNPDLTSVANVCGDYDKEEFSVKTTWRDICWIVKLGREGKWEVGLWEIGEDSESKYTIKAKQASKLCAV